MGAVLPSTIEFNPGCKRDNKNCSPSVSIGNPNPHVTLVSKDYNQNTRVPTVKPQVQAGSARSALPSKGLNTAKYHISVHKQTTFDLGKEKHMPHQLCQVSWPTNH